MFKRLAAWLVIGSLVAGHPGIAFADGDGVMTPAATVPIESSVIPFESISTDDSTAAEEQVALSNFIADQVPPTDDQAIVPIADTNLPTSTEPTDISATSIDVEEPPAPLTQEAISRLVRDIGSDSFIVRQAALETLRAALARPDDSAVATLLARIGTEITQNNPTLEVNHRIRGLVNGIDLAVILRLAIEPGTSRAVLTLLAQYQQDKIVGALAALHLNMPPEGLNAIAVRDGVRVRRILMEAATNPNTRSEALNLLARMPGQNVEVLRAIADNPNTPPEALSFLARVPDQDYWVLVKVAANPNTPPETLSFLGRAPDQNVNWVLEKVAANPNTPPETLSFLGRVQNPWVLAWVAANPNTPPETLDFLARVPGQGLRVLEKVAANPNTPPETLDFLAQMPNSLVLAWVAANPNTPPETLSFLAERGYEYE